MTQIPTPFYLPEPLFKNILSYCGLTNKEKLINQLNLFEKDWYEDYCNYLTEIMIFPDLTKFGDLEEKYDRTELICMNNHILDTTPWEAGDGILSALILIG
tara:strand:- start:476 stop:778 length:303 start_codon:yes stop_codon:yes gene_type:complete